MAELVIIRGLPGSGKSTRARREYPNHLLYEPDHLFEDLNGQYRYEAQLWDTAVNFCLNLVDAALARGEDVVIADVFPNHESLVPFADVAAFHGAKITVLTCEETYGSIHRVPKFVVDKMRKDWQ